MRAFTIALLSLVLMGAPGFPCRADPVVRTTDRSPSLLERYLDLGAEGLKAYRAGRFAEAERTLASASALLPSHPRALLALARAAEQAGDIPTALRTLKRYADLGLVFDIANDPVLRPLAQTAAFDPIARKMRENARPIGHPSIVFTSAHEPVIWEKIAFDGRGDLLFGTVHEPAVRRLVDGNVVVLGGGQRVTGVFGMQAVPEKNELWLATSITPEVSSPAYREPEVVLTNLATGAVEKRFVLTAPGLHQWGDIEVAPDGVIYASDGATGQIWRLDRRTAHFELLVDAGIMRSPQGMLVSPDGRRLVVADYTTGIHVIDRATGKDAFLPAPANTCLIGVDTLAQGSPDRVYAVQNGLVPARILELTFNPDWSAIRNVRVVAASLPEIDQPTGAIARGNELYFVATSQWSEFGDKGELLPQHDRPAIVEKLTLD